MELAATACLAVCPQLQEIQQHIAMATPGLIASSELAQAQLKVHLQITG